MALKQLEMVESGDLMSSDDDFRLLEKIYAFVKTFQNHPNVYRSLVLVFKQPTELNEEQFEKALWERLQALHNLDRQSFSWAVGIALDPRDEKFSFSLAGEAFYVIGMHANSRHLARRFEWPAIVLNLHAPFDELRVKGKWRSIRDLIRKRGVAFSGTSNPLMHDFGENSEAAQHSGRPVSEDWKCPFHPQS